MVQVNNTSQVKWVRYISKSSGRNVLVVEITDKNIEAIRTLWKKPQARVGDFMLKTDKHGDGHLILLPGQFERRYRRPYLQESCNAQRDHP